jgi:hypothetical protein
MWRPGLVFHPKRTGKSLICHLPVRPKNSAESKPSFPFTSPSLIRMTCAVLQIKPVSALALLHGIVNRPC